MIKNSSEKPVRLDKWLKIARIFKTRTQANHACEERRIKINGVVAKSAKMIKVGDTLTIKHNNRYRELTVLGIALKSVPAKEANALYREEKNQPISEESLDLLNMLKGSQKAKAFKYPGRPTKKERRNFVKVRGF